MTLKQAEEILHQLELFSQNLQGVELKSSYGFTILYRGITTVYDGDPHWYQYFIEGKLRSRDFTIEHIKNLP